MNEILLANAALALLEQLLPRIQQMQLAGQISVEQQQSVRDRYTALRAQGDAAFTIERPDTAG